MCLCFGTFATTLNCCRVDITQDAFIANIIKSFDSTSPYIELKHQGKKPQDIKADSPAISKLLHCKRNFVLPLKSDLKLNDVIKNLKTDVLPFIDEDKKGAIILTLLNIIQDDQLIDSKNAKIFKNYIGKEKNELLLQDKFLFSNFLARILLYTVFGKVDNITGAEYVKTITLENINFLEELYHNEYIWKSSQTMVFSSQKFPFIKIFKIFNQAILDYKIDAFIDTVDPVDRLEEKWLEPCDDFLNYTEKHLWIPFSSNIVTKDSLLLKKIQSFAQTLDDYLRYLCLNTNPLHDTKFSINSDFSEKTNETTSDVSPECNLRHFKTLDTFVPKCLKDSIEESAFSKETLAYRQNLISIYEEIIEIYTT